jgi:hypothetical protein
MTAPRWLPRAILGAASLLAPRDRRTAWLAEWTSELWYIPREEATTFCLGAFRDALWLRRNSLHRRTVLDSPVSCLACLAGVAAVSVLITICLPAPRQFRLRLVDMPAGWVVMLALSCLLLPGTRFVMGRGPECGFRLRRAIFLAAKLVLVQPIMLCGFVVLLSIGPAVPFAPQLGILSLWILTLRWVLVDQRQRCPVCLRRLTYPVRIGSPSGTFLEWYGAESMCSSGHGFLQAPEISASYAGRQQWLRMVASR